MNNITFFIGAVSLQALAIKGHHSLETDVIGIFEHFRTITTPAAEIVRKVDACVAVTADLLKIINERMSGVTDFDANCLKDLRKSQYARSIFTESESLRSYGSVKSKISDKVAEAATELAEKQANLAAQEEESKYQLTLEMQRAELKKTESLRDVEVAKAKLNELKRAEQSINTDLMNVKQETDMNVITSDNDISSSKIASTNVTYTKSTMLNASAPTFTPKIQSTTSTNSATNLQQGVMYMQQTQPSNSVFNVTSHNTPSTFTAPTDAATTALARAITESLNLSRLPIPEPTIFTGNPLQYLQWRMSFGALIENKNISDRDKIYYLSKYVSGTARKAIDGYFYSDSSSAYECAIKVLNERYGHPFVLQKAFRDKLDKWPKIAPKDSLGLRELADFPHSCRDAIPFVPSFRILDDCSENQKMLSKLPDWLITRWNRDVTNTLESTSDYPKFSQFVDFIVKEAKIACNPVSSHFALNDERRNRDTRGTKSNVKSLATNVRQSTHLSSNNSQLPKITVCQFCDKKGHLISSCSAFNAMTIERKRSFVKEKRLCFGCMKKRHTNNECNRKLTCNICQGRHPSCMHEERPISDSKSDKDDKTKQATSLKVNRNSPTEYGDTSMIVPVWVSSENNPTSEILVYALLDTQNDTTFIHEDTETALNIKGQPVKLNLSTMTSQQTVIDSKKITGLMVRGFNSTERIRINCAYTRGFIPVDKTHIPTNQTANQFCHLTEIANEIPPLQSCDVGLLIGYNCPLALAPRKIVYGEGNEPYAIQTTLGWSIVGYSSNMFEGNSVNGISNRTSVKEVPICTPNDMIKVLESDFKDISSERKISQDDLQFLKLMEQGIHQREDKHYEMPLPFKSKPKLPDNKRLATVRLDHLKRKLQSSERYFNQYKDFIEEMLARGDAELATTNWSNESTWYIPHHGVFHPKKPEKLRVVYDCSAKYGGTSLNEHLLTGPDLTNRLAGVLCRFRSNPIAIMCDIEKMFHQFYVNEEDRDFLQFLWWENNDLTKKPSEYRMNVHLFGAASSPGCANYGLKHLAKSHQDNFPEAAFFIQNDFYVDDGLTSVKTEHEAIKLIKDAQSLCAQGGLRLQIYIEQSRCY